VTERVLVLGADGAGMSAAHQALRVAARTGRRLEVVVLERSGHTSYSACGLPYWLAGDVASGDALVARTAAEHRERGIDLRLGAEAVGIDLDRRRVSVRYVDGAAGDEPFDQLVVATGSRAAVPPWALAADGRPVPGVRALRTLDDGAAWLATLEGAAGRQPRTGVVAGGGYIGLETAEAFLRRGLDTTLVTRGEVMGSLDPDMGARVRQELVKAGVTVLHGSEVDGVDVGAGGAVAAVLAGAHRIPADVVALGLGAVPNSGIAAEAGLAVGSFGGLLPDARQQVADGVWAAGDCCESTERHGGRRVYVPLGTHANKQGRVAGENLAGGDVRFAGVLGTAITGFAAGGVHVEIGRTGPTLAQAAEVAADLVSLVTESSTSAGYMPQSSPIAVKVLADRRSRRLIGMQIVGGPGSGKRIDTAAAAIWGGMTVDDVAAMDLSYAPPFSPVFDPVQIACRRTADLLDGDSAGR